MSFRTNKPNQQYDFGKSGWLYMGQLRRPEEETGATSEKIDMFAFLKFSKLSDQTW